MASQSWAESCVALLFMLRGYVSEKYGRYPEFDAKEAEQVDIYGRCGLCGRGGLQSMKSIKSTSMKFIWLYLISLTGSMVPKSWPDGATARATIALNACLYSGYCATSALMNAMFC